MDGTIIVADDDKTIRTVLSQALIRAGARVRATSTVTTLWNWVEEGIGDVVVTDVMMPDGDALDLLPRIKARRPDLPVIVMSAQNTVMTAIRANEAGAYEYLPKPFDLRQVLAQVNKALNRDRTPTVAKPVPDVPHQSEVLPIVGASPAMQEVYRLVARLMNSELNVLITGESGTGKDLVARVLHDFSARRNEPFISLSLGSMGPQEIEATFGVTGTPGQASVVDEAAGGTLFLNEVGDLPLLAQSGLVRILQDLANRKDRAPRDHVRVVAATRHDLQTMIDQGAFRDDLFYRLNVVPIRLPPLRERVDDIADLIRHFLKKSQTEGAGTRNFSQAALDALRMHPWPGNVRELENLVNRLVVLVSDDQIELSALKPELEAANHSMSGGGTTGVDKLSGAVQAHLQRYFDLHGGSLPPAGLYHRILKEVELPLFDLALAATHGNQVKTAELLGINRNTLRKKIKEHDIRVTRGKKMM